MFGRKKNESPGSHRLDLEPFEVTKKPKDVVGRLNGLYATHLKHGKSTWEDFHPLLISIINLTDEYITQVSSWTAHDKKKVEYDKHLDKIRSIVSKIRKIYDDVTENNKIYEKIDEGTYEILRQLRNEFLTKKTPDFEFENRYF